MEFICVLSVEGSLTYYHVKMQSETKYLAVLQNNNGKRDDVPDELHLEKTDSGWKAQPWHQEIVQGLSQAIESNR